MEKSNADSDKTPTSDELKARFGRDIFNDFDCEDPRFNDHFTEILDAQLAHCPVAHSKVGEGYLWVTRYEDVKRVAQDWKTFSNAKGYQPNRPEGFPFLYPQESDPPIHTTWRNVLNPFFTPKACAVFEPQIRADANELIDRFIDRSECEFISEFGGLLPGWVFFKNLIGVPIEDLQMLVSAVEWSTLAPTPEEKTQHFLVYFNYLAKYLESRAAQAPRGDLVDAIIKGVTHEDGTVAPFAEKLSVLVDLTIGGIATTTYVMASALHHLATHPQDREELRQHPEMLPQAMEEFIRAFPPIVALGRSCTRDVDVGGTQVKQGDYVMVSYSAASRDPRVVANATEVDIARKSIPHTTFGVGPHHCIGANLARVELIAALDVWMKRIPDFSLKTGTAPTYVTTILRTMRKLELVF